MLRPLILAITLFITPAFANSFNPRYQIDEWQKAENSFQEIAKITTKAIIAKNPNNYMVVQDDRGVITTRQKHNATGNRLLKSTTYAVQHRRGSYMVSVGETCRGAPELMYNGLETVHSLARIGPFTKKKESNQPKIAISVTQKRDYVMRKTGKSHRCYGLHTTAFSVIGTHESHVGVGVYGVVTARPKVKASAGYVKNQTSSHYYAGVRAKYTAADSLYEGRKTVTRVELVAGVERKYKNVRVGLEVSKALVREFDFNGRAVLPVKVMARATWTF
jgi:hypothetical protein